MHEKSVEPSLAQRRALKLTESVTAREALNDGDAAIRRGRGACWGSC